MTVYESVFGIGGRESAEPGSPNIISDEAYEEILPFENYKSQVKTQAKSPLAHIKQQKTAIPL